MKKISDTELKAIIYKHAKWVRGEDDGDCANLYNADLCNANLRDCDILAGLLYMMGKITNVVPEAELKKFITERTGMSEEAYKAIDDIIAKEYEEADNKPLICEGGNE